MRKCTQALTTQLEKEAEKIIREIEAMGGMTDAVVSFEFKLGASK